MSYGSNARIIFVDPQTGERKEIPVESYSFDGWWSGLDVEFDFWTCPECGETNVGQDFCCLGCHRVKPL